MLLFRAYITILVLRDAATSENLQCELKVTSYLCLRAETVKLNLHVSVACRVSCLEREMMTDIMTAQKD